MSSAAASGGYRLASLDRVFDALERGGFAPRRGRAGHIQARCPVHEDRAPSLSVDWKPERGGMVVVWCHACQATARAESIVAALGLRVGDLFDEPLPPKTRRRGVESAAGKRGNNRLGGLPRRLIGAREPEVVEGWREVCAYPYVDAGGEVLAEVVREERLVKDGGESRREKRFTQRRAGADGQWEAKAPAAPLLYRLPDVLAAIAHGEQVWLTEGEKDADALVDLGVCATTNAGGAGNFRDELVQQLVGARIVCAIDRDAAGYRRAADLTSRLAAAAAELRLVLPAVLDEHADAADHLAAGHGLEEFLPLTVAAAAVRAAAAAAEAAAGRAGAALGEAQARMQLAAKSTAARVVADERRRAVRWAHEAARGAELATRAAGDAWAARDVLLEAVAAGVAVPDREWGEQGLPAAEAAMRRAQEAAAAAWQVTGAEIPAQVRAVLDRPTPTAAVTAAAVPAPVLSNPPAPSRAAGGAGGEDAQVLPLPTGRGGGGSSSAAAVRWTEYARVDVGAGRIGLVAMGERGLRGVLDLDVRIDSTEVVERPQDEAMEDGEEGRNANGTVHREAGEKSQITYYVVSWTDPSGERVTARIDADRFVRGEWLADLDMPGLRYDSTQRGRSQVFDAIRSTSAPTSVRIRRTTGWRLIDGLGWTYLHAGGGINAAGTVELPVQLDGKLGLVDLPDPIQCPAEIRAAFDGHSRALVGRLGPRIGAALAGAAYRAVLGWTPSAVVLHGVPGTYKSAVAALAMHHFGQSFDRARPSVSMSGNGDTINALREKLWAARDTLIFGDDFAPDKSVEAAAIYLSQVLRMQYNREGRGRKGGDRALSTRGIPTFRDDDRATRASLLLTSEVKASAASGGQRGAFVDLARGELRLSDILELDRPESRAARATFMASLIQWIATDKPGHCERAARRAAQAQERRDSAGYGDRVCEPLGHLEAGWELVGDFLVDVGAYTELQRAAMMAEIRAGLDAAAAAAVDADDAQGVGEQIRQMLASALRSGLIHVTAPGGREPIYPEALRYGWRRVEQRGGLQNAESYRLEARGDWAGVITTSKHGRRLHLDPTKTMQAVLDTARRAGEILKVSKVTVARELADLGLLRTERDGDRPARYAVVVPDPTGAGGQTRMWDIDADALFSGSDIPDDPTAPAAPTPPADVPGGGGGAAVPDPGSDQDGAARPDSDSPAPADGAGGQLPDDVGPATDGPENSSTEEDGPVEVLADGGDGGTDEPVRILRGRPAAHGLRLIVGDMADPGACFGCGVPTPMRLGQLRLHIPCSPPPQVGYTSDGTIVEGHDTLTAFLSNHVVAVPEGPPQPESPAELEVPAGEAARPRWAGPVLVADVDGLHLPGGELVPLPDPLTHLGQLADQLPAHRIGWGGDRDHLPEHGHLVLSRALAAQLGLPAELPERDSGGDHDTVTLPALTGARGDGWERSDWRLRAWMRMWRPGAFGARVVLPHLQDGNLDGLLDGDPTPQQIVARAGMYAQWTGMTYRISPSVTGLDLLRQLRPAGGRSMAVVERVDAVPPAQDRNAEQDIRWRRPPTEAEARLAWVHRYDVNSQYLAATSRLELGLDVAPEHHVGDGIAADLKRPGYWRVLVDDDVFDPLLPNPLNRHEARREYRGPSTQGRWVTTPTLRLLLSDLHVDVEIVEAWTWAQHTAVLDPWYARLRDAIYAARDAVDAGTAEADVVLRTIKNAYRHGIGRLAKIDQEGARPGQSLNVLWRPDWRHPITAEAARRLYRRAAAVAAAEQRWPLAIATDCLWYASDDPDPRTAAPAGLPLHPRQIGKFKPAGTAALADVVGLLHPSTDRRNQLDAAEELFTAAPTIDGETGR